MSYFLTGTLNNKIIMKNYLNVCFLLCMLISFGQKPSIEKANLLFKSKSFVAAAKMYEVLPLDKNTLQNLGDCYYYNFEMEKAVNIYDKLFDKYCDSISSKEYMFRYSQSLMGTNRYEQADIYLAKYYESPLNSFSFFEKLRKVVPYNYTIQLIDNEDGVGDFGLVIYDEKVVFSSLRSKDKNTYSWNDKPFLDLYEATVTGQVKLENVKPFSSDINSKTHESSACFTKDGKSMFFSRTNMKRVKVGEEFIANVKIYNAILKDGKWTDIKELPFSSDLYTTAHPNLSFDEKKLYFSSDMPGSIGSMDIYVVDINEDGTYGTPINLGSNVNTIHREQFPFESSSQVLYFSSDGHQGFGGLDIFMTKDVDNIYKSPLNLGETINSSLDDFSFVLKDDLLNGYFSSNRLGDDNLYSFNRDNNSEEFLVEGEVKDINTDALLIGTEVSLFDNQSKFVESIVVGDDALYSFKIRPNETYKISAKVDFYTYHQQEIRANDLGEIFTQFDLDLESFDDAEELISSSPEDKKLHINLENIYFDTNKSNVDEEAEKVLDKLHAILVRHPFMEIELNAHTDFVGNDEFNLKLSVNRANAVSDYLIKKGISKSRLYPNGFGETKPLILCGNKCSKEENSINRRCEFIVVK